MMKPLAPKDEVRFKLGADTCGLPMLLVGRIVKLTSNRNHALVDFGRPKKIWVPAICLSHFDGD